LQRLATTSATDPSKKYYLIMSPKSNDAMDKTDVAYGQFFCTNHTAKGENDFEI